MPPEEVRVEETRAWLAKAADDLRAVDIDLGAKPPLIEDALFHCQQGVEKTLKAFLTWHDRPFRKVHDLAELGGRCAQRDPSLLPLCRRAEPLTVYATAFRYPGEPEEPTQTEAQEALGLAREVLDQIVQRLPVKLKDPEKLPP